MAGGSCVARRGPWGFPDVASRWFEEDHSAGDGEGSGVQVDALPAQGARFADTAVGSQEQVEKVGAGAAIPGPDGFGGAERWVDRPSGSAADEARCQLGQGGVVVSHLRRVGW